MSYEVRALTPDGDPIRTFPYTDGWNALAFMVNLRAGIRVITDAEPGSKIVLEDLEKQEILQISTVLEDGRVR